MYIEHLCSIQLSSPSPSRTVAVVVGAVVMVVEVADQVVVPAAAVVIKKL